MTENSEAAGGILGALEAAIDSGLQTIVDGIGSFLDPVVGWVVKLMLQTPYPTPDNPPLGPPATDDPFYKMYQIYETGIQPMAFLLLFFIMGVVMFSNIWRDPRKRMTAFRRVIFAIPALLMWWPVAGWYLKFVQFFTTYIIDLGGGYNNIVSGMVIQSPGDLAGGLVGAGIVYASGIAVVAVNVAVYFIRWMLLQLYLPGMAFLIVIACVPYKSFSGWAMRFMRYFASLSLIPVPVAFCIAMLSFIDTSALVSGGEGGISIILFDMIKTVVILALTFLIPIVMFPASGKVSSAVSTGAMAGRFAAAGAASGSSGSSDSSTSASSSGITHGDGESGDEGYDGIVGGGSITSQNSFSQPATSKAKRQRERAAKMGAGARKAAGKSASGASKAAKSAAGHTYKNYKKDGSTAKGLASDAKQGARNRVESAKAGMSERAQRVREAKDRRIDEFQEEWGPSDSSSSTLMQTGFTGETRPFSDDTTSGGLAYADTPGDSSGDTAAETTSEDDGLQFIETGSVDADQTFDRNSSDREIGGLGDD